MKFKNEKLQSLSERIKVNETAIQRTDFYHLYRVAFHNVKIICSRIYQDELRVEGEEAFSISLVRLYWAGWVESELNELRITPLGWNALVIEAERRNKTSKVSHWYTNVIKRQTLLQKLLAA